MGLSDRVPNRVDEAANADLLRLLDAAIDARWRGACRELEVGEVRAYRWAERGQVGELADAPLAYHRSQRPAAPPTRPGDVV